jgi:hypothetical protein|tara:strand:+ start:38599 stop:38871 length:273 start_codon:yes stop_codon:yes gene_type:complete
MQSKGKLIPGAALIYEHADGITYARYRDAPHNKIKRWIVGGEPTAIARATGELFGYHEWKDMMEEAKRNPVLKRYLKKAVEAYCLTKGVV